MFEDLQHASGGVVRSEDGLPHLFAASCQCASSILAALLSPEGYQEPATMLHKALKLHSQGQDQVLKFPRLTDDALKIWNNLSEAYHVVKKVLLTISLNTCKLSSERASDEYRKAIEAAEIFWCAVRKQADSYEKSLNKQGAKITNSVRGRKWANSGSPTVSLTGHGNVSINNLFQMMGNNSGQISVGEILSSELHGLLEQLHHEFVQAIEAMTHHGVDREKIREAEHAYQTLVNEATFKRPRPKWYNLSFQGLKDATTYAAGVAPSLIITAEKVLDLLNRAVFA